MSSEIRVAIVQHGPAYLNKSQTLAKAEALLSEISKEGAHLAVFGETWFSGYPAWIDHCPNAALWNHEPVKEVYAMHYHSGISIPGPETELLGKWAKAHKLAIVMGVNEVVQTGLANGSIFNSLIVINEEGVLVNHHRKLMPTYTEKMVYDSY